MVRGTGTGLYEKRCAMWDTEKCLKTANNAIRRGDNRSVDTQHRQTPSVREIKLDEYEAKNRLSDEELSAFYKKMKQDVMSFVYVLEAEAECDSTGNFSANVCYNIIRIFVCNIKTS
jgi:hypothetical protein